MFARRLQRALWASAIVNQVSLDRPSSILLQIADFTCNVNLFAHRVHWDGIGWLSRHGRHVKRFAVRIPPTRIFSSFISIYISLGVTFIVSIYDITFLELLLLLSSFIEGLSLILRGHVNVRVVVRPNLHFIMVTISCLWFWNWAFISESAHFSFSHEEIAARLSLVMIIILIVWTVLLFRALFNCHNLLIHTQIVMKLIILAARIWITSSSIAVSLARSRGQERIMSGLE